MPKVSDVGVIVGRFQVHQLHAAHQSLIDHVYSTHRQTVIVLGLSQARMTALNPLDFESRKQMLLERYPKATILYIKDLRDDAQWSARLDTLIEDVISPAQSVTLYGGRDSFIAHYSGKYHTETLEPGAYLSGTELRKTISRSVRGTEDFRAGVIWASANGYERPFVAVDVAVQNEKNEVLMVRKPGEVLYRFPGGFVKSGEVYETAARREVSEETGASIDGLRYLGSFVIDDWRYRDEAEKITSVLFGAVFVSGPIRPADDVTEARWFARTALSAATVMPEHLPLVAQLQIAKVRHA